MMRPSRLVALAQAVFVFAAAAARCEDTAPASATALVASLGSLDPAVRERAEEDLVASGDVALPFLDRAADRTDPEVAWRVARVERRIRWRLSAALLAEIGGLLDDYEKIGPRMRIERLELVAQFGESAALETLLAASRLDPDGEVRARARRLAGRIDLAGRMAAAREPLRRGDHAEAIRLASLSLAIDPTGPAIHYRIGCLAARAGKTDLALESIARAIDCGFTNLYLMEEDADLAGLWKEPRFRQLVQERLESLR